MTPQFIAHNDPYTTPTGFTETKTPDGGSAYNFQGQTYTRNANGFNVFAPQAPNQSLTTAANNAPAPAVITSKPAREAVTKAQTGLQDELAKMGGSAVEGQTISYNGQEYVKRPDGQLELKSTATPRTDTQQATKPATTQSASSSTTQEQAPSTNTAFDALTKTLNDRVASMEGGLADFQTAAESVRTKLNTSNQALIDTIKKSFERQIEETKKTNTATLAGLTQAGIRAGRSRYEIETEDTSLANEMREGIRRVSDLEVKRDSLIAQAELAASQEDYKQLYSTYTAAQKAAQDMNSAVVDMYKLRLENEKIARDTAQSRVAEMKVLQELDEKTVASLADLALASLTGDEDADRLMLAGLATQYGIDTNMLTSKVMQIDRERQNDFAGGDLGLYQTYVEQEYAAGRRPVDVQTFIKQIRTADDKDQIQVIQDPLSGEFLRYNKTTDTIEPIGVGGIRPEVQLVQDQLTGEWLRYEKGADSFTPAGSGKGLNPAQRNNNPGNIKATSTTLSLFSDLGATASSTQATDGGKFLQFPNAEAGFEGMTRLLKTDIYKNLSVEAALKKWSNSGYGANVAKEAGIDPKARVSDLPASQITSLVKTMARFEGYSAPAQATPQATDPRDEFLASYAEQYASTGKIPPNLPKGAFARVAELAKALPKQPGSIIDVKTGVKPDIADTRIDAYAALYDVTKKIAEAKTLFEEIKAGVIAGSVGKVFGAEDQARYMALRTEITDLLARARTGAAITANEERMYAGRMPGRFNQAFFVGTNGSVKLDSLEKAINDTLNTKLQANGLEIVGYVHPSNYDKPL